MTTVTITIRDNGDEIEMEGKLDDPSAIDNPPTGALIVGSYIAANLPQLIEDAGRWFFTQAAAQRAADEMKGDASE